MAFFDELIYLIVSTGASVIGSICGLGGGIIIKPLLDAMGTMSVETVSFLSGCTVFSMAVASVVRSFRSKVFTGRIDLRASTPLAVGAVIGGIVGQAAFQALKASSGDPATVGAAQSFALFLTTFASLLYTLFEGRIAKLRIEHMSVSLLSGVGMGIVASFIGIGGGPINIMVLSFFFSMETKQAAANSLYVVMFSQASSIAHIFMKGAVPDFSPLTLALMIAGGIGGALIGSRINKKISSAAVRRLYIALMLVIVAGALYNAWHFMR